jgi:predicted transcriptional regulator
MYIDEGGLRKQLVMLLRNKTRNQIVQEIKSNTGKFHQYQIDKFLQGKDVTLCTVIKLDNYVSREIYLNHLKPL